MQYSDFQNQPSSEKITLAVLEARVRLVGWTLHSGSVYKIQNFDKPVVLSIEDSGIAYASVSSVGSVTAGKYFFDRLNNTLYLRASDSSNPNSRFLVLGFSYCFANVPIALPYDLDSGYEVFFEPMIKSTSQFGVEIDTVNQVSEAIEGSGTLTLINDQDFWPANFDKITFENQRCSLYSFNRNLDVSEKKLMFKGRVQKKTYTKDTITFNLIDQFAELKAPLSLATIGELGARTDENLNKAYQRVILGKVFGNLPTNIDQVLTGYPVTGTVSTTFGIAIITGTGTIFLTEFSPDDSIIINGKDYKVQSVDSDTQITLSQQFAEDSVTNVATLIKPDRPKRYMNRVFKVSGHAVKEPVTTISGACTITRLTVTSTKNFYEGDVIYVGTLGSGQFAQIQSVIGSTFLRLAGSLNTVPAVGTSVLRPAVQNVRIGSTLLTYYRDFTFDATTSVLTLRKTAESNASAIFSLPSNITITNGSRVVTGTGFKSTIFPGYMIGVVGNANFFEVLSVDSDTQVTLRQAATFGAIAIGRYQTLVYDPDTTPLSLDVLGLTVDGTSSGVLIETVPALNKYLLTLAGLQNELNSVSFDEAEEIAYQTVGLVIPEKFDDTALPIYRDVLNQINKSVFGSLVENVDFKFTYRVLGPDKTAGVKFTEADIISFSLNSTVENMVGTAIIEYRQREYNYLVSDASVETKQRVSDNGQYVLQTNKVTTITTCLAEDADAQIAADRWAFLLDQRTGVLEINTKMQGFLVEVGDIIEVEHRKFFERYGSTDKAKLALVQSVKRSGTAITIEASDLSNAFNRVACINDFTNDYDSATSAEKLHGGYITDQYGLISNNPLSHDSNLIW